MQISAWNINWTNVSGFAMSDKRFFLSIWYVLGLQRENYFSGEDLDLKFWNSGHCSNSKKTGVRGFRRSDDHNFFDLFGDKVKCEIEN